MTDHDDNETPPFGRTPPPVDRGQVRRLATMLAAIAETVEAAGMAEPPNHGRTYHGQQLALRTSFELGYRAAMQYAEKVAGEPVLLDSVQIDRAWQHAQAEIEAL